MSRLAQRGGPSAASASGSGGLLNDQEDKCPNCRNSRYLNPNLTFLMSPLCYHKMCSTCVDRIFGAGPAECPIAGCHRVLRKTEFRKQTFADAAIEREVDIRRRVDAVLGGHTEDDFEDLLAWNNYLEQVEDIAFELTQRINEDANWAKLRALEAEKRKRPKTNADKQGALQLKRAKHSAVASGRADSNTPAPSVLSDGGSTFNSNGTGFVIRGLKKREEQTKAAGIGLRPNDFDPFGGLMHVPRYFMPIERYDATFLDTYKRDEKAMAGGYDMHEYCLRALNDAFAGLGVVVGDERIDEARDIASTTDAFSVERPERQLKPTIQDDDVF